MTLSVPYATRIKPLTKTVFDGLLATSEIPGELRAQCARLLPPPSDDGAGAGENEGDIMDRLHAASSHGDFVLHPTEPNMVREYGEGFMTFYYHPALTEWMNGLARGMDLGLPLRITGDGDKLQAQSASDFHHEFKSRVFSAPYAPDDLPEIRWTKPAHDPRFLKRAIPALYRDQIREFTRPRGQWFMNMAASLNEGLFVLIGDEHLLIAADRDRYQDNAEKARVLEEGRTLLWEIKPEKYRRLEILDPDYFEQVVLTAVREQAGLSVPTDRRLFFWQTYLEGVKRPGQR